MQLHLHNHLFCFSTTIIHFFMMHKVYTLSTKHAWNKRNKTTTSIACVVDKENLNRHRAGSFIFFLYFQHLSYSWEQFSLQKVVNLHLMNTKVFITNLYFVSEKTFGEILVILVSIGLFPLAQLCLNSFNIFTISQ